MASIVKINDVDVESGRVPVTLIGQFPSGSSFATLIVPVVELTSRKFCEKLNADPLVKAPEQAH